ncbi:MAG: hypothetical protein EXR28_15305 [Betaproteobacteria bacterium]|nr:hypothetical protein [Betaproteobacteria bacterium]
MNADSRPDAQLRARIDIPEALLGRIASQYVPATFATSLSIEDMVLTDAILRNKINIAIFTLDTGRMRGDTLAVIDAIVAKYGNAIRTYRPEPGAARQCATVRGRDAIYKSIDLRKQCCEIRKVEPLRGALANKRDWFTGMRREQSVTRNELAVQVVVRPGTRTDFRGYAGRLASGVLSVGDELLVLPSNRSSRVKEIVSLDQTLPIAVAGDSVTVVLEDDIDISRGDMLCDPASPRQVLKSLSARICWMSEEPLSTANRFVLKHASRSVKAKIGRIVDRVDINTLQRQAAPTELAMNDIAHVTVGLAQPLFVDAYDSNRETGSFILTDETSNHTVAVGMIEPPMEKS